MALTNAERQAALKARREETARLMAEQNAALMAENAVLRAEVGALKDRAHKLEVAALKAQIKKQEPAVKPTPAKAASSIQPDKKITKSRGI